MVLAPAAALCYFGWRKTVLPRLGYLEIFCRNYSKFSDRTVVAQRVRLGRYSKWRGRRVGHELLFDRLSASLYVSLRLAQLQAIFIPLLLFSPLVLSERSRSAWYRLAVWSLRQAGPAFVKLGQWAATRPDLLPPAFCQVLSGLHSRAPEHSIAWTRMALEEAGLDGVFDWLESKPVGSGSVAQVHRARQRKDGRLVALKVLHPGVAEHVHLDLQLLSIMAAMAHRLPTLAWLQLPSEIAYFQQAMEQQLDLRFEAYTLARFRRNFSSSRGLRVSFPEPLASSRQVLVESYEAGLPIGELTKPSYEEDPGWRAMKTELAESGLKAFLQMLLWDNLVHADLHPGNMLITFPTCKDTVSSAEDAHRAYLKGHRPSIVFLDTGLVTELSGRDFDNFTDLFRALVFHADGHLAGRLMIERAKGQDASKHVRDPEGFCQAMQDLIHPVFSHAAKGRHLMDLQSFAISPLLLRTFDLVREHHVHLEGAYTNLVMSLVCVEGLGRQMAPGLSLRPLLLSAGLQYLATSLAKSVTETVEPYL